MKSQIPLHTTHYACPEIIERDGMKSVGCCCSGHTCKPRKPQPTIKEHFEKINKNVETYLGYQSYCPICGTSYTDLLSLFRTTMEEIIGEDEDEQRKKIEGLVTLATIPNLRNELRKKQRQRMKKLLE